MKRLLAVAAVAAVSAAIQATVLVELKLDQQIDVGLGEAIFTPDGRTTITFEDDGTDQFVRSHFTGGDYYDSPYINFTKAGVGSVDVSDPSAVLTIDLRYFQADNIEDPYGDAPIFLIVATVDESGGTIGARDFGRVYFAADLDPADRYPTWQTVTVYLNDPSRNPFTDYGPFDPTKLGQVSFWGTDWGGLGEDFADARNLKIEAVPEPATGVALVALCGLLVRRRRR